MIAIRRLIMITKSIFRGVQSYEVRNNATRRLLRKEKGDVKPQDWRDDIQRHQLEGTPRIYQIGEQVDMRISRQWVPGTIVNIFYSIYNAFALGSHTSPSTHACFRTSCLSVFMNNYL